MMTSASLRHLIDEARTVMHSGRIVIFGSTSVLGAFPEIAEETKLYEQTLDSDFIPDPWDDATASALHKAIGKTSIFFRTHGYYADIVRPDAFDQFPPGFQDRLVAMQGFENVYALDVHDMAVAKLFAGRPKDIRLLAALVHLKKLNDPTLRERLWDTPMAEKWIVKTNDVLDQVMAEANRLTESGASAQELYIAPA